jgi:hypothetical protein
VQDEQQAGDRAERQQDRRLALIPKRPQEPGVAPTAWSAMLSGGLRSRGSRLRGRLGACSSAGRGSGLRS